MSSATSVECAPITSFKENLVGAMEKREKSVSPSLSSDQTPPRLVHARQSKLLGLWAASKMGLVALEAESYAKSIVRADIEKVGRDDVARKIVGDLAAHGLVVSVEAVQRQMERILPDEHHAWDV
jgi:hypothetical protein